MNEMMKIQNSTHLSRTHSGVLIDKGTPFDWDFDINIWFVQLLVGDLHIGNAFVRCDMQFSMALKTIHMMDISLFLLAHSGTLVHVVCSPSRLTTEVSAIISPFFSPFPLYSDSLRSLQSL